MSMALDANDLILFARVMEAGSFSGAASRTGLPKSTVSRRIAALEKSLGERLLTRSTRRLAITEFGEGILEHARRLLGEAEAAADLAQHRQATPQGLMRVSLPPEFQELDLVSFLDRFTARYPQVRLELDVSPRRVDLLAERFDLAVRVARQLPDDASLVARRLADLRGGLYASPSYLERYGAPVEPDDLARHVGLPIITSTGEAQPWALRRGAERWAGLPVGPLAANSIGLQSALAVRGLGIVGLSDRFAEPWVAQGALRKVLPQWQLPTATAWAVTPGRRLLPTRTRAFIDMLHAALQDPAPEPSA